MKLVTLGSILFLGGCLGVRTDFNWPDADTLNDAARSESFQSKESSIHVDDSQIVGSVGSQPPRPEDNIMTIVFPSPTTGSVMGLPLSLENPLLGMPRSLEESWRPSRASSSFPSSRLGPSDSPIGVDDNSNGSGLNWAK